MKRKSVVLVLGFILTLGTGCRKCYYCQNSVSVCTDPHYRIIVQSDNYGTPYYNLYLDSLAALGWSCKDTTYNKDKQVCAQKGDKINNALTITEGSGYTCTPVQ